MSIFTTEDKGRLYTSEYRMYFRNQAGSLISPWHDIPLRPGASGSIFNMIVEIPRWTNAKMEIVLNEPLNPIKQDVMEDGQLRYVANCFPYHGYIWNYGALPQTWTNPAHKDRWTKCKGDNDLLDCIEIGAKVKPCGAVIQVKILGCVALIDQGESDYKLICIDITDPMADKLTDIQDIQNLMPALLRATVDWLKQYKVPDGKAENKFAFGGQPQNSAIAMNIVKEAHEWWEELSSKDSKSHVGDLSRERTADPSSPYYLNEASAKTIIDGKPGAGPPGLVDSKKTEEYYHYVPVGPKKGHGFCEWCAACCRNCCCCCV